MQASGLWTLYSFDINIFKLNCMYCVIIAAKESEGRVENGKGLYPCTLVAFTVYLI